MMESKTKFLLLGILILAIFLTLIIFGFGSFFKFFKILAIIIFIVLLIGFVFWVVYTIFFKAKKIDIVALQSKKFELSAKICKPSSINNLYLSGDRLHESVKMGKLTGFCVIQNPDGLNEYVYTFKRFPPLLNLFEDNHIIRVSPEDSTRPVGDVYLKALSIVKISEYFYLNKDMLNIGRIDEAIYTEAKRGILFLTLSEMKTIVDNAMNLDSYHQKEVENSKLMKLPKKQPIEPTQV